MTHEAAHGIFHTLAVADMLDPAIYDYIKSADANSDLSARHIIGEQFANWFDWRYNFRRNTALYLRLIWQSWLEQPLVWQSKPQYLARSFAVLLCEHLGAIAQIALVSREAGLMPLLRTWWYEFVELTKEVPNMPAFLHQLQPDEQKEMFEMVSNLLPLLRWFEQRFEVKCGVANLTERLSPQYDRIAEHVVALKQGRVILEGIVDPTRLHLALLQDLAGAHPEVSTEVAYIYSLQNCYQQHRL